jgi:hypothetical protein
LAYVTLEEMKRWLRNERGADDDDLVTEALDAATAAIDDFCQRSFTVAGSGAARVYVPTGTTVLPIYDATTVTAITEDGTTLATTYWQAEPLNLLDGAGKVTPYTAIRRIDGGVWAQESTYPGKASISVTATWGWVATPAVVKAACRSIAKDIISEQDVRNGLVSFGDFAARAVANGPVQGRLMPLRRGDKAWGLA